MNNAVKRMGSANTAWETYEARKKVASQQMTGSGGHPVGLAKKTSNLFRHQARPSLRKLDLSGFNQVLEIDPVAHAVDVEGMIRYDALCQATLVHGLLPPVVPQLRSITVGGAISGGGIEASSFRHGFVHERVLEMEVLLASGEVITCRPNNEHRDLFYGLANSYGTLGYILRARIPLVSVKRFVELNHRSFTKPENFFAAMETACGEGRSGGAAAPDFVEGVVFNKDQQVLTTARFVEEAPWTRSYRFMRIYYRSLREQERDYMTTPDFLWRWDTDWFWCSRAFGMENPVVRFGFGAFGLLRSTTYWKIRDFLMRRGWVERWERVPGEDVIQDVEIPVGHAASFLDFLLGEVGVRPVWICPAMSPGGGGGEHVLYQTEPAMLYINFGFWGRAPQPPEGESLNRRVERKVMENHGKKSLYSTSCFPEDEFWEIYNRPAYRALKERYDPGGRLRNLYEKCVGDS